LMQALCQMSTKLVRLVKLLHQRLVLYTIINIYICVCIHTCIHHTCKLLQSCSVCTAVLFTVCMQSLRSNAHYGLVSSIVTSSACRLCKQACSMYCHTAVLVPVYLDEATRQFALMLLHFPCTCATAIATLCCHYQHSDDLW
jgi:hypothetical protein